MDVKRLFKRSLKKLQRFEKKDIWRWSLIGVGVFAGLLVIGVLALAQGLPSNDDIVNHQVTQSTKIYDRTGKVLLFETGGGQKRTVLPFEQLPQSLKDAVIAIEDERFYTEPAFDWRGILRSAFVNLTSGRIVQGASTITMQLARNAFLSPEQTPTRKLRELILAIRLSRYYSKDEILGLYLNEIPYGSTFYGAESAAHGYFGKSATELTLGESAILAAMLKAPTYYSPWGSHQKELFARQKLVLTKMVKTGAVTQQQMDEALKATITFQPQSQGIKAVHFSFMVQDYLVQKYGDDLVNKGGLKITTTLDWDLQQAAEKAVFEGAARNEKLYKGKNAALVAEDPKTGQILALAGSRDYFDVKNEGNFNVATQGLRQPGSALKPFVYMTAFQKGYTPESILFDVPTEFTAGDPNCPLVPTDTPRSGCFHPQNFDHTYHGPVSMRYALAQSMNIPAVKTLYLAGMKDVLANANSMGLKTLNDPNRYGLTLVLGGGEVRLIDLTEAYSVLAQEGVKHEQALVLEVRDRQDNILESFHDQWQQVVEPQYPRLINDILSDVQARAGLFSSSLGLTQVPGYQIALKTGTSNDYHDTWTVGYTPFLVAGVWAGNNDNTALQRNGSSILAAVPIWNAFMVEAAKKFQPENFTPPEPVHVDKPILNGQYGSDAGIHSELYYIDKSNPTGALPDNPGSDRQFINWETALQAWLGNNPLQPSSGPNPSSTTPSSSSPSPSPAATTPAILPSFPFSVEITSPTNGDFISDHIHLVAQLTSGSPITGMKVFFNDVLIQHSTGNYGTTYTLMADFMPTNLEEQNSLIVEVTNQKGETKRDEVIVYH